MTQILNIPAPTKETKPRQRSINISDLFLTRFSPPWTRPPSLPAYTWRNWVLNQPVAMAYRETLIANILSLDWNITPRDASYKKELEATVKYYTKLLNDGGNYLGTDYTGLVEWIAGDVLDLPFGGASEVGRKGDVPGGRVAWLRPLDAGTLYPTLNAEYPVVQYYQGYDAVAFPAHAVVRTYLSPQSYIYREGWGMAPPEKAYFAINLLNTGDKYYANLLLDVPTAGILDLGDMEKSSAEEWVTAFKTFVKDTNTSFRVPVLYEHNNPVSFIPFGKVPNDIMYDTITIKYAALLGAAYGMTTSDIGLKDAGSSNTLAGTIRDERRSRRTGFAKLKLKMKYFFDKILPPSLEFTFTDFDSELSLNLGRARLATATAFNLLQTNGNFSQQEVRSQIIQDGLVDINIPDKLPPQAKQKQEAKFWHDTLGNGGKPVTGNPDSQKQKPGEPETVGSPKIPSGGGEGDIKKMASLTVKSRTKNIDEVVRNLVMQVYPKTLEAVSGIGEDEIYLVKSTINNSLFEEDLLELQPILKSIIKGKPMVQLKFSGLEEELKSLLGVDKDLHIYTNRLEQRINKGINPFLANALTVMLNDITITEDVTSHTPEVITEMLSLGVNEHLENLVNVFVSDELDKTLQEIRDNVLQ